MDTPTQGYRSLLTQAEMAQEVLNLRDANSHLRIMLDSRNYALERVIGELGAAVVQFSDSDDQIICDHIRKALGVAKSERRHSNGM